MTAGAWLGPYEILSLLGAGGQHSGRFEQEARAIAALNHPHICQIYDVGADYLVLEYVEGQTLADRIRTGGAPGLPQEEALRIARQIAEGLEEAHRSGILHRDLKPGNVMVTRKGVAKLLDFGLSRLGRVEADVTQSQHGVVVGTAAYMSPEQAEGRPVDVRSDVFSFGAVLYEMIAGSRAFGGTTALPTMSMTWVRTRSSYGTANRRAVVRRQSNAKG